MLESIYMHDYKIFKSIQFEFRIRLQQMEFLANHLHNKNGISNCGNQF